MSGSWRKVCSSAVSSDEEGAGPGCNNTLEDDDYNADNEDDNCASEASSEEGKHITMRSTHFELAKDSKTFGGTSLPSHKRGPPHKRGPHVFKIEGFTLTSGNVTPSPTKDSDLLEDDETEILRDRFCQDQDDIESNEENVVMKKIYRSASLECSENLSPKPVPRKTLRSMSVQFSKPPIRVHRNSTTVVQPDDFDFDLFDDDDGGLYFEASGGSTADFREEDTFIADDGFAEPSAKGDCCYLGVEQDSGDIDAKERRTLYSSQTSGYKTSSQENPIVDTNDAVFATEQNLLGGQDKSSSDTLTEKLQNDIISKLEAVKLSEHRGLQKHSGVPSCKVSDSNSNSRGEIICKHKLCESMP